MFRLTDYTEVLHTLADNHPCLIEDIDLKVVWTNTDFYYTTRYPIDVFGELIGYVWTDDEVIANKIILFITLLTHYYMEEK